MIEQETGKVWVRTGNSPALTMIAEMATDWVIHDFS
jgi:hypothetical protein